VTALDRHVDDVAPFAFHRDAFCTHGKLRAPSLNQVVAFHAVSSSVIFREHPADGQNEKASGDAQPSAFPKASRPYSVVHHGTEIFNWAPVFRPSRNITDYNGKTSPSQRTKHKK
jgi:hypothetical protein